MEWGVYDLFNSDTVNYAIDFNVKDNFIICNATPLFLSPDEFEIAAVCRFEVDTYPADGAVGYAIGSRHSDKDISVSGYSEASDAVGEGWV